jgi:hypothetical protein
VKSIPSFNGVSYLKHNKFGVITLLLFGMVIGLTGIVCADTGVNATPETQSLGTVTTADVVGLAMETDAGAWTLTDDPPSETMIVLTGNNQPLVDPGGVAQQQLINAGGSITFDPNTDAILSISIPESLVPQQFGNIPGETWHDLITFLTTNMGYNQNIMAGTSNGIHTGALDQNQVQYTTAYDANIVAQGGKTSFIRQMTIDTRNKVTSQSNIKTQTGLTFAATDNGGNVVGSENLMIDGAGDLTYAREKMLCPFVSSDSSIIPAFCNIVQAGSRYDLTIGSVTTNADSRFVGTDVSDNPVVLNYAINIKPYGTSQDQIPATGSAMAYIKAHIQEARGWDDYLPIHGMNKSEDLTYTETSSVQGTMTTFNKDMHYSSQVTGVAMAPPVPTLNPIPIPP